MRLVVQCQSTMFSSCVVSCSKWYLHVGSSCKNILSLFYSNLDCSKLVKFQNQLGSDYSSCGLSLLRVNWNICRFYGDILWGQLSRPLQP